MHQGVICRCPNLHHGAHPCLVLSSATFFASEYVEGSGQYEVLEAVLHPAGVPAEAQEEPGPSIAPTRGLWSEEPSSDPAADSYADFIKEKEDEEANAPQAGDDVRGTYLSYPALVFCRTYKLSTDAFLKPVCPCQAGCM